MKTTKFILLILFLVISSKVSQAGMRINSIEEDLESARKNIDNVLPELDAWGGVVTVDKNSRIAAFEEGSAPYAIVKLPPVNDKYIMRVAMTFPAIRDYGIFWPTMLLLDDKMQIVGNVSVKPRLEGSLVASNALIKVNIDPKIIKYLIFYMKPELLGRRATLVWTKVNGSLQASANFSQTGELQIYHYRDTKQCLWSSNLDKCQPRLF